MKTTIEIEIRPFSHNSCNEIENSRSNKLMIDIISNITEELKKIDTSNYYFNLKINTNDK